MEFIYEKIATICKRLKVLSETETGDIGTVEFVPCGYKTTNTPPENGWTVFPKGSRVSGRDDHFWFRASFTTGERQEGKSLWLKVTTGREGQWDATNPQGLVFLNGKTIQALDTNHTAVPLEYSTHYTLLIYFYVGMIDCAVDFIPELKLIDTRIEKLYYDLSVPLDAYKCLDPNREDGVMLLRTLERAVNELVLWPEYSERFYVGIDAAEKLLEAELYSTVRSSGPLMDCIGHTHIDVAWLWTYAQTREKAQRTFSTVLELMRRYPEFKFMSSQPQLYKYLKESAPELYEEVKERIREGRWEVEGAMWVEADANIIGGESMVRQMLYGKRFIKNEFGVDSKVVWLPDVFGYSAAMPQIMKKCGVDYFVTSKISWNEMDKMPYDTFLWEGIDGTEIFTNFLTAQDLPSDGVPVNFATYNADITPSMAVGTWNRYQQKQFNNETVITYGFGDGGGGPTAEMLERGRRLSYGLPGIPRTRQLFAGEWVKNVEKNFFGSAKELRKLPKWVGELYMELHRGTYTSIAKNKRNNRKSEFLLQKAEALSAAEQVLLGGAYPQETLNSTWEAVLLNQFHDVIPGSSIFEVYEDSDRYYADIRSTCFGIVSEKLASLGRNIATNGGILVYNPLGFARRATVRTGSGTYETESIPALGWSVLQPEKRPSRVTVTGNTVENDLYQLTLDDSGRISRLYDKREDREVLKPGAFGNEIQIFEDYPKEYDAWEITNYYKQKMWVLDDTAELTPVTDGDRAGIRISRRYLSSDITQTVWLYSFCPRIDFETIIDWHEEHQLVKASFPLDVHASRATYEIQFGNLERPTHENTSWDAAKFEVCAHKWADISEDGYGVSLLNDCKYGHSAEGSTLKLTLLKCATYPNPHADKGHHELTYSLLPHKGDYRTGRTVQEALCLNQPAEFLTVAAQAGPLPESFSLISCDCENILIDTVKKAEDSDALIIRLYDAYGRRSKATLNFGFDITRAVLCDMLENESSTLETDGRSVSLPVSNFEIVTLKIE